MALQTTNLAVAMLRAPTRISKLMKELMLSQKNVPEIQRMV